MSQVLPEQLNQWFEQFDLTGYPNGIVAGVAPKASVMYQLSSAQLKALQTTAVLLVAAPLTGGLGLLTPPNGFALIPTALRAEYLFLTTTYTIANADNAFQIEYVGKTTSLMSITATGLVDQSSTTIALGATGPSAPPKISKANSANLGLEVKLAGTTPALTLGLGSVILTLDYTILPLF